MRFDEHGWRRRFITLVILSGLVAIGVTVAGGVLGLEASYEVGGLAFVGAYLILHAMRVGSTVPPDPDPPPDDAPPVLNKKSRKELRRRRRDAPPT